MTVISSLPGSAFNNAVEGIRIDYKPGNTHGSKPTVSRPVRLPRRLRTGPQDAKVLELGRHRDLGCPPDGGIDVGVDGVRGTSVTPASPPRSESAARIWVSRSRRWSR